MDNTDIAFHSCNVFLHYFFKCTPYRKTSKKKKPGVLIRSYFPCSNLLQLPRSAFETFDSLIWTPWKEEIVQGRYLQQWNSTTFSAVIQNQIFYRNSFGDETFGRTDGRKLSSNNVFIFALRTKRKRRNKHPCPKWDSNLRLKYIRGIRFGDKCSCVAKYEGGKKEMVLPLVRQTSP
jgi:hypothetical protein